jgi:hypothetical protein
LGSHNWVLFEQTLYEWLKFFNGHIAEQIMKELKGSVYKVSSIIPTGLLGGYILKVPDVAHTGFLGGYFLKIPNVVLGGYLDG